MKKNINNIIKILIIFIFVFAFFTQQVMAASSSSVLKKLKYDNWYEFVIAYYNDGKYKTSIIKDKELTSGEIKIVTDELKKLIKECDTQANLGQACVYESKVSKYKGGLGDNGWTIIRNMASAVKENVGSLQTEVTESDSELKKKNATEIHDWLRENNGAVNQLSDDVKKEWLKNDKLSDDDKAVIKGEKKMTSTQDAVENAKESSSSGSDSIYQLPSKDETGSSSSSLDDMIGDADSFLNKGDSEHITTSSLQEFSNTFYNILLTIGIIAAVIAGMVIGIKFMMGGAEEKANIKEILIPYVVGCAVVFGSFAIWKLAVTILSQI